MKVVVVIMLANKYRFYSSVIVNRHQFLSGGFLCVELEYLSHFFVHKYGSGDERFDILVGNSSQIEEIQNKKNEQRMEMQEST